jgi:hypothetical protein
LENQSDFAIDMDYSGAGEGESTFYPGHQELLSPPRDPQLSVSGMNDGDGRINSVYHMSEHGVPYQYTPATEAMSNSINDSSHLKESAAEYSVTCPYECGTVLTGIHAVGNLTRHLKSRSCPNSPRRAVDYPCPIHGCMNRYARSDGCK